MNGNTALVRLCDIGQDASPVIQRMLDSLGSGTVLSFEKGVYPLFSPLSIRDKQNFVLDGGGCVFSPHYDREGEYENSADCFHISGCENLTLRRFTVDASLPANAAGRILHADRDSVTVRFNGRVPFSGKERFIDGMTFSENGIPLSIYWFKNRYDPAFRTVIEGEIACTAPRRLDPEKTYLGDQTFRVFGQADPSLLRADMLCSVSHTYYGLVAFTFRNCRGVCIEDVEIPNFGGFGFLILPRCADFVFRRVKIQTRDPAHQPYPLTADGIHTTGLGGTLLLEDCIFERLGDDSINLHTQVMTVASRSQETILLKYDKVGGIVSPYWLKEGDELWVYDPVTLRMKGCVTAGHVCREGCFLPRGDASFVQTGDFVTNRAYFPDAVIRRCIMRHCRGRGCCIQGVNSLLMEDCEIGPARGAALYLSTAFNEWKEAGPLQNLTIRHNRFLGIPGERENTSDPMLSSAVLAWLRGDAYVNLADVHRNITVEDNLFSDYSRLYAVCVFSTDGVRICGNQFRNCRFREEDVHVRHCSRVEIAGNLHL